MNSSTVVVIPIYRIPTASETFSLQQCVKVLGGKYTLCLVHPEHLDVSSLLHTYEQLTSKALSDTHFTSLGQYNAMMLSTWFYRLFESYEYMLVYQLDAFIFRDELQSWVEKGYDWIGAPWLPNHKFFQYTVGDAIRWIRKILRPAGTTPKVTHAQLYYNVGNGGFCLRKISKMIAVTEQYKDLIDRIEFGDRTSMEDVFLAVYLKHRSGLRTPHWREAIRFAFESNFEHCHKLNKGILPMGCHGWSKPHNYQRFWHKFIACNPAND